MGLAASEESLLHNIVHELALVLVSAGWINSFTLVKDEIMTKFGGRLAAVARLAIRLQKVIGQDITSTDFEVIYVENGARFDPAMMDDAYAETPSKAQRNKTAKKARAADSEGILCTSELGLRKLVREQKEGKITEWRGDILIKPKVVLFSELKAATN